MARGLTYKNLNNSPVQNETKEKVKIGSQSFITELIKPAIVSKRLKMIIIYS